MFRDRDEAITSCAVPMNILKLIEGGDGNNDFDALWVVAKQHDPKRIVELGTRQGISTRVMRDACPEAQLITVDPEDCMPELKDLECVFLRTTGEQAYLVLVQKVDMLFIDTDPHSYEQTKMWMDTWVSNRLSDKGIVCFHDTIKTEVSKAIKEWVKPPWNFVDLGWGNGLGVLWRDNVSIL